MNEKATIFLRLALGLTFLSTVCDRLGLLTAFGVPGFENMTNFLAYTEQLTPYLPKVLIPVTGWSVTILEAMLGLSLIAGFQTKRAAFVSGCLLVVFALSMSWSIGIKSSMDYSVWSAAAGAFMLATCKVFPYSIDSRI